MHHHPDESTVAIPGYRIITQLFASAKTIVYRALRETDQQPVVIKLLRRPYPTFNELLQLRNQHTITHTLNLPGVVRSYSLQPYHHSYALILEDFGGISLAQYVRQKAEGRGQRAEGIPSLSLPELLPIALQLTDILSGLYQHHVVHKDLKPTNILINPETKQVKLTDFSMASLLPRETQEIQNPSVLEGTLAYLSPEQTGRMNRGIDYRSDFYALGVTLYELLTGQLPFQSNDPMELIQCHIARQPLPVHALNVDVPLPLSAIVSKLMAKNAEDRYQSACGLKHDLESSLHQWQTTGQIAPFELAQRDVCDRFLIPEKLYGREQEVQAVLDAFDRVVTHNHKTVAPAQSHHADSHHANCPTATSAAELILITGGAGVGKTAVVNEVHKPIARNRHTGDGQRSYFIKGKYDQLQRHVPFSALVQAFRHLMEQLLSESDAQLQGWRAKILAALGENAQVMLDVLPELAGIIGKQPPVLELSGEAAQHRFQLLFQKFMQVFATADHPLVIFLDDLQWADLASLTLLQWLISEPETGHVLLIGAYRDSEVAAADPLALTLQAMRRSGVNIHTLTLAPLTADHLNQLTAETLSCAAEVAAPLAELVYGKTQGNPFFATQFLRALYNDELIYFNPEIGHWECDLAAVRSQAVTDDVVEFMALQLQKLPETTQAVLKLAACLGNQFDLALLATVSGESEAETAAALWKALQARFVLPQNQVYKFYQESDSTAPIEHSHSRRTSTSSTNPSALCLLPSASCLLPAHYKFLHDRVQQAAYALIPDNQKPSVHLNIGWLLLTQTPRENLDGLLFELVNHLNRGAELIIARAERSEFAQLNLLAGRKARAATAYQAAVKYFTQGQTFLAADSWQGQYELSFDLYVEAAEAAYLSLDFVQMQACIETVLSQARSLLDQAEAYRIQLEAYKAQGCSREAIELGLHLLHLFGIDFPRQPDAAAVSAALQQTQSLLASRQIEDLVDLPAIVDPALQVVMGLLARLQPVVCNVDASLFALIVLRQIELALQHGNCAAATLSYVTYGMILLNSQADVESGYRFGRLALRVLDRLGDKQMKGIVLFAFNNFLRSSKEPLPDTLSGLLESYAVCLETGDLENAAYAVSHYCEHLFWTGQDLETVEREMSRYHQAIGQLKQAVPLALHDIHWQAVLNLLGRNSEPQRLNGTACQEQIVLATLAQTRDHSACFALYLLKFLLSYFLQDHRQALSQATQAETYLAAASPKFNVKVFYFYYALVLLAHYRTHDRSQQEKTLAKVAHCQTALSRWANHAPMNFLHKHELVEAEKQRVLGNRAAAIEYYDRAIETAQQNGYVQDVALANELAAEFYLEWGKERIAQDYLHTAYYSYARWGAILKVKQLEQHYAELLTPISQQQGTPYSLDQTLPGHITSSQTSTGATAELDLATVLKASQMLSQAVQLDQLLVTLLNVMIENAGADKCVLILLKEDAPAGSEQLCIEAVAQVGQEAIVLQSTPLATSMDVPIGLIYSVKRTRIPLIIADATKDAALMTDRYIQQQQPKSVLCTPILHQGTLLGLLYLENRLTVGAFPLERLEILKLLCTQAAISLENARDITARQEAELALQQLNDQLEQRIQERTAELAEKNAALQASEERFRQFTENISSVFWMVDAADNLLYTSPSYEQVWCRTVESLYQQPNSWIEVVHSDDRSLLFSAIEHKLEHNGYDIEYRIVRPNGQIRWIHDRAFPVYDEQGQVYRFAGIAEDVSSLKQAEAQVRTSLHEKEILLREIHHRVKNNLQVISALLSLQGQALADAKFLDAIQDSKSRLHSIALIHESLYQSNDLGRIDFSSYIQRLADSVLAVSRVQPQMIQLHYQLDPVFFNIETAIPCGLLLNELLTNAVKHAFVAEQHGIICITLQDLAEPVDRASPAPEMQYRYQLTVQDNGVGMANTVDTKTSSSLGLRIVHDLASQLQATLELTCQQGTRFTLKFSELKYRKRL